MDFTYTLTFGNQAENGVAMQKIGRDYDHGLNRDDMEKAFEYCEKNKLEAELIDLREGLFNVSENWREDPYAGILIIRNGLDKLSEIKDFADKLIKEQQGLEVDKHAIFRGKVKNKRARWNLCFADFKQEPDYENGKGRVYNFKDLKYLKVLRKVFSNMFGDFVASFPAEMNYYYDTKKCGIGWHSDLERKYVFAVRLGAEMPLAFRWYQNKKPIGDQLDFNLKHGDIYVMSEKAVAPDGKKWKNNLLTLRHAAGCKKYIK